LFVPATLELALADAEAVPEAVPAAAVALTVELELDIPSGTVAAPLKLSLPTISLTPFNLSTVSMLGPTLKKSTSTNDGAWPYTPAHPSAVVPRQPVVQFELPIGAFV